jgi:hypothetical protein
MKVLKISSWYSTFEYTTQHNNKGHYEKLLKVKQHFATTFKRLTNKTMVLRYPNTFWIHFTMLAPDSK